MDGQDNETNEERKTKLSNTRKRSAFFKLYLKIRAMNRWVQSVYRPDIELDENRLGTLARSVIQINKEISDQANRLLDILESDKNGK